MPFNKKCNLFRCTVQYVFALIEKVNSDVNFHKIINYTQNNKNQKIYRGNKIENLVDFQYLKTNF